MNEPDYLGHRKRIKQRFLASNLEGWQDYEVLEFILSYAIPRKDTKALAKNLLKNFCSLSGVFDADLGELVKSGGISEHTAILIKLFKDTSAFYSKQSILNNDLVRSPELALNYLKPLLKGSADEQFYAMFLDSSNHFLSSRKIQEGIVNKSVVYPRKVVEDALNRKAAGVIIAHNHPSGSLDPSKDDINTTNIVKKALETVDVALLDHIIVSKAGYFSFKEKGLL